MPPQKTRRHRVAAGWFRPRRAWDKDKVFAHKDRNFSHKDSFLAPYARKSTKQKREARLGASPLFLSSKIMILPCREKDKRQGRLAPCMGGVTGSELIGLL